MLFVSIGLGLLFAWFACFIADWQRASEDQKMASAIITFLIFAGGSYTLFDHFIP